MSDEKVWRGSIQQLATTLVRGNLPLWVNEGELSITLAADYDALLRELTTAREQIAGLEREQAKDAVEWADLCLVHKKEAEAARTALAEKEAELNEVQAAADSTGILAYKNMKIESIRETNEELCKKVMSLGTENTRLRAELKCERMRVVARKGEVILGD